MEDILVPIFAIIFTFGAPAAVLWQWLATRHKERITIIERGLDPVQYRALYTRNATISSPQRALKWSLFLIFFGIGLWLGAYMVSEYDYPQATHAAFPIIGAGVGLALYYLISRNTRSNADAGDIVTQ